MIEEKDIRQIYEGVYKIAEEVGDSKYTHCLAMQLHDMLVNPDIGTQKLVRLTALTLPIDFEYYTKLENLANEQMWEEHE